MIRFQQSPARQHPAAIAAAIVPAQCCRRALVLDMACTMREMGFAGEAVNPENLRSRGYTPAIISRFGTVAAAQARRDSVRRIG